MFYRLGLFVFLLVCGNCIDWEAYGNFTDDNITTIRGYVQDHFPFSTSTSTLITDKSIANFTEGMSNYLNSLWDIAWNVVVSFNQDAAHPNYDTIMYGYGFRKHWMWINGYKTSDETYFGIVVWKDYNCYGWITFDGNNFSQSTNTFTGSASDTAFSQHHQFKNNGLGLSDDIWKTAQKLSDFLTSQSDFSGSDKAFTIVACGARSYRMYGRFCAKAYLFNPNGLGYDSYYQ